MLIVQPCEYIETGDGYYRMHEPMRQLGRLPGVTAIDVHICHRYLGELVERADVLVLPFFHGWEYFPIIEQRRRERKVTVFETNDYFLDTQPWNPIYPYWLDPEVRQEHIDYIKAADAIQTSSPRLALHWSKDARRTAVFKNHLAIVPPLQDEKSRPFTIGWAGSQGHLADWYAITPALQRWLDAHPDVHLSVMTHSMAKEFIRLPDHRYHFRHAGAIEDYLAFIVNLDVGFAPLLHTEYNLCRSDVKFLEYAAHGVVGIYRDFEGTPGPYADSVRHGETGFLYYRDEDLFRYLDQLYADRELLKKVRLSAHQYVVKERRMQQHIEERARFYGELRGDAPPTSNRADEFLSEGIRDHGYTQLHLDDISRKVYNALAAEDRLEATVADLTMVLARYPNYALAHYCLGRIYNQLKRPQEALRHLERATELRPLNASYRCELGRSFFLLGNRPAAQQHIEAALGTNPYYVPGWRYFFGVMKGAPEDAIERVLEKADAQHPHSLSLALQGALLVTGTRRSTRLTAILDRAESILTPEQRDELSPTFAKALGQVAAQDPQGTATVALLERARKLFPHSAALLHIYAKTLEHQGRPERARECYLALSDLHRQTSLYLREFPPGSAPKEFWALSQYLARRGDPAQAG